MDRKFLMEKAYVSDRQNPDGLTYKHALEANIRRLNDRLCVCSSVNELATETRMALREGKRPIPVGTLGFVREGLSAIAGHHVQMRPIEIPAGMEWHAGGRSYQRLLGRDIPKNVLANSKKWFIKDIGEMKRWNNLLMDGDCAECIQPNTPYAVSERVCFLSEFRLFVCRGKILGLQNYDGNPLVLPDTGNILAMFEDYEAMNARPKSYTMDVGVIKAANGALRTGLVEIHPFVSCGLYGLYDREILDMLADGIAWYLEQDNKDIGKG